MQFYTVQSMQLCKKIQEIINLSFHFRMAESLITAGTTAGGSSYIVAASCGQEQSSQSATVTTTSTATPAAATPTSQAFIRQGTN